MYSKTKVVLVLLTVPQTFTSQGTLNCTASALPYNNLCILICQYRMFRYKCQFKITSSA